MNAIAGIVNLGELGVDAVHNNLHKTWTIPHGGGGPGDAIVAVSEKLKDFLPGKQIYKDGETGARTRQCAGSRRQWARRRPIVLAEHAGAPELFRGVKAYVDAKLRKMH